MEIEVKYNVNDLALKLNPNKLLPDPMKKFFNQSLLSIQRNVAKNTKRDTGALMGRLLQPECRQIDSATIPMWGRYTSGEHQYVAYVEYDTRPHFPPLDAITPWAKRHNRIPFLVARAIAKHGTKGAHMFEKGYKESTDDINRYLDEAAKYIEENYGK